MQEMSCGNKITVFNLSFLDTVWTEDKLKFLFVQVEQMYELNF